jgi:hypothetical protein
MVDIFIFFLRGCGFEIGVGYTSGKSYLTKQGKPHRVQKDKHEQNSLNVYLTSSYGINNPCIGLSLPLDGHVLVLAIGFGVFIVLIKFNVM